MWTKLYVEDSGEIVKKIKVFKDRDGGIWVRYTRILPYLSRITKTCRLCKYFSMYIHTCMNIVKNNWHQHIF